MYETIKPAVAAFEVGLGISLIVIGAGLLFSAPLIVAGSCVFYGMSFLGLGIYGLGLVG